MQRSSTLIQTNTSPGPLFQCPPMRKPMELVYKVGVCTWKWLTRCCWCSAIEGAMFVLFFMFEISSGSLMTKSRDGCRFNSIAQEPSQRKEKRILSEVEMRPSRHPQAASRPKSPTTTVTSICPVLNEVSWSISTRTRNMAGIR